VDPVFVAIEDSTTARMQSFGLLSELKIWFTVTVTVSAPPLLEHPLREDLKLRGLRRCHGGALDRAPGHEAISMGGERANERLQPVGDDERLVVGE